jgi:hypothetical protein
MLDKNKMIQNFIDLISPGPGKGTQVVIHIPVTGRAAE